MARGRPNWINRALVLAVLAGSALGGCGESSSQPTVGATATDAGTTTSTTTATSAVPAVASPQSTTGTVSTRTDDGVPGDGFTRHTDGQLDVLCATVNHSVGLAVLSRFSSRHAPPSSTDSQARLAAEHSLDAFKPPGQTAALWSKLLADRNALAQRLLTPSSPGARTEANAQLVPILKRVRSEAKQLGVPSCGIVG